VSPPWLSVTEHASTKVPALSSLCSNSPDIGLSLCRSILSPIRLDMASANPIGSFEMRTKENQIL
jgi:hypothetical protein